MPGRPALPSHGRQAAGATIASMSTLRDVEAWIDDRFPVLAREHRVPGAALGVLADGEMIDAATGVLSLATGVEATPDSVFQIGSTTKLWTASLVMQLVDEGRLDLDQPVRRYLPEFRIADEAAAASITARQLLSHTAGFEGDIFTDTGKGDDCLEKFVLTLGETPQLFPPGERFSYNNAGYCVLGTPRRGAAREALRRLPARASLRAPRPHPRGQRSLRGHHVPRRGRPRPGDPGCRPRAGADLGAGTLERAGRVDARDAPAGPARLRADAHERGAGGRRDRGAVGRRPSG